VRNFSVGGLKLDERLVAFIVSWVPHLGGATIQLYLKKIFS